MSESTVGVSPKMPSLLGGAMIIAGTAVGAGMFANPTATSGVWFIGSMVVLLYTWFCMYASGLMILEANLHYPLGASFDTIVKDLLGQKWNVITGVAVAFVLYILTYAYIFVGGGLTQDSLQAIGTALGGGALGLSREVGSVAFTLVVAFCVWLSTRVVDRFSTILIGGMVITFFLSVGGMLGTASSDVLLNKIAPEGQQYWIYVWGALPVCLASFGYHGNVPSLVSYYQKDGKQVARSLLLGTLIALVIYILWQFAVHGNLPRSEFAPVIAAGGDVSALLTALSAYISTDGLGLTLNYFAYMAIASSFLGVTLGLFDYLADLCKFSNSRSGRLKTALLTFLPPLVACLLFPTGFVKVIGYVGLGATVWTGIVPALLVRASRKRFPTASFRAFGGRFMIGFVFLFAIINILAQVLSQLGVLPTFTG
ncbi:tryptophan permease [Neisseriaceae bacterium CLB008]|nr:tryptophan permease [Neisseriaceae bacterium]